MYFLSLEISRNKYGILVCQRMFALDLIIDLGLVGSKPTGTHLDTSQRFTSAKFDHTSSHKNFHDDELLSDPSRYQNLVGKLLYLTMTRPNISYDVHNLSQFMHIPKMSHIQGALRIVRYLKNAPGLRILLSSKPFKQLIVYYDAD